MESTEFKLLFAGPMGAGKTTAINAISDTPCVSTEATNTDRDQCDKALTTTALDYGQIALDDGNVVHLYGTPGQERFSFMWPILATNAAGVVILLDGSHAQLMQHLDTYVDAFWRNGSLPMVIGVGRLAPEQEGSLLNDIMQRLEEKGHTPPVLAADVRQREDVLALVDTLLCLIEVSDLTMETA
jgi:signal recognition particle receptor subunit beta